MAELFIESQSGQSDLLNTAYSSEVTWGSAIPKGMIAPFGRIEPPEGWLICDGSTLNALQDVMYRSLFDAIGTTWGGTGENDFKIPDLRGQFLRGVDAGAGNDPDAASRTGGDSVSSTQNFAVENATGSFGIGNGQPHSQSGVFSRSNPTGTYLGGNYHYTTTETMTDFDLSNEINTSTETRPKNVAVLYCIKY